MKELNEGLSERYKTNMLTQVKLLLTLEIFLQILFIHVLKDR